jgi:short-subunit dehydrogenase
VEEFYTLITGSSSGIGKALAFECARRKMNLILVSRPSERLSTAANEVSAMYNVDVKYIPIDLTENDAPQKVFEWCRDKGLKVNYLINNAGTVGTAPFDRCEPEYLDSIIMLNIRALTLLTRLFLPELKKYRGSKILNVGSMSGFFPIPYKSVYSASKAFVHSFSRSIEAELKGSGVGVYLVAPNGVQSNPRVTERIKDHKLIGALVSMSAEKFAILTLDKVEKGKKFYVPLFSNKLLFVLSRILPDTLMLKSLKKEFRKELGSEQVEVYLTK